MMIRNLSCAHLIAGVAILAAAAIGFRTWTATEGSQEHLTPAQLIEVIGPELPDEQEALIADGVLTFEEYEGAVGRLASCIQAGGLSVARAPGKGVGGVTELSVQGDLRTMTQEQYRAVHQDCITRHTGRLGIIWASQNRPTAAQLEDQQQRYDACLVARGMRHAVGRFHEVASNPVDGPFPPSTPEWRAIWDCREETRGYR